MKNLLIVLALISVNAVAGNGKFAWHDVTDDLIEDDRLDEIEDGTIIGFSGGKFEIAKYCNLDKTVVVTNYVVICEKQTKTRISEEDILDD